MKRMQSEFLTVALEAVKQAEAIILKYLDAGVVAELKADQSPVTIADQAAEAIIKQTIHTHFPDHTFYGEEGEKVDLANPTGYTWIIDPIDGTKSYLRRSPLFATQLALMHDGELVLGVSNAPLMGELMYAEKGQGSFLNGQPVHVSDVTDIADAYLSFGSLKYFEQTASERRLMTLAKEVRWARGIGDFWSYHLLAQGKLDIMIEPVTKLWDVAALSVIVREAGGSCSQLDGSTLDHATTTALASNGRLHDELVARFAH
jgi:histidinol-phosphatase